MTAEITKYVPYAMIPAICMFVMVIWLSACLAKEKRHTILGIVTSFLGIAAAVFQALYLGVLADNQVGGLLFWNIENWVSLGIMAILLLGNITLYVKTKRSVRK